LGEEFASGGKEEELFLEGRGENYLKARLKRKKTFREVRRFKLSGEQGRKVFAEQNKGKPKTL